MSGISDFCVSTVVNPSFAIIARKYKFKPPRHTHGSVDDLVPIVSNCIRVVLNLHGQILRGVSNSLTEEHRDKVRGNTDIEDLPRTQFYMWSAQEKEALQKHLVNLALNSTSPHFPGADGPKPSHNDDIRLCIGALCEGASLLATPFQPYVLEGALLGFLGKGGQSKGEMKSIMQRLGIGMTRTDTVETMRQKIVAEIDQLRLGRERRHTGRKTVGLLPRVVVLKKELQRLVALPVPGWWDAKEAAQSLGMASGNRCPDEDELFRRYWQGEAANLKLGIEARNNTCQELVGEIRRRMERLTDILVNRARVLTADWVDVCRVDVLRKLFYMQQVSKRSCSRFNCIGHGASSKYSSSYKSYGTGASRVVQMPLYLCIVSRQLQMVKREMQVGVLSIFAILTSFLEISKLHQITIAIVHFSIIY